MVPCYNEAARLQIEEFRGFIALTTLSFVFVNDGSTDDTLEALDRIRSGFEDRVRVLDLQANGGKAEAVRRGVLDALGRGAAFVGYWDADLATPLDAIPELGGMLAARPELDMIFGCRLNLLGRKVERRAARHYLGRIFATAASAVLHLPVYDTQCGAKIFRVNDRTCHLFDKPFGSRWVFDVELIARYIARAGSGQQASLGIYEFPLRVWTDVAGSKVRPRHFLIAFLDVLRIYRRYGRQLR